MFTEEEIARRLPAWSALSELFVDTEFNDLSVRACAQSLMATGFDLPAIDAMLRHEVAPVFHRNLLVGNWTGWTEADVREMVVEHLKRRSRWRGRFAAPLLAWVDSLRMRGFEASWKRVQDEMARRAATGANAPPPSRSGAEAG